MPKRLFIADDEPGFRVLLRKIAESRGWNVTECANGLELISALTSSDDDGLVLLDIMMPEMDGIEVIDRLANLLDDRPVHFITSGPRVISKAAHLMARERGINVRDVLIKPISVEQVTAVLAD